MRDDCRQEDKTAALLWLLQEAIAEGSPTLIFTATRHHVEFLHMLLTREGIKSACVYGQMDQVGAAFVWQSSIPEARWFLHPLSCRPKMNPLVHASTCRLLAASTVTSSEQAV